MAHDQSIIRQLRKEDMASVSIKTTGLTGLPVKVLSLRKLHRCFLHAIVNTSTFISSFNYNQTGFPSQKFVP